MNYYKSYGLAIEGLVRHHKVDPLEYNAKVDDALPLEEVIKPNPQLRGLLESFDRENIRLWLFTNAYINHANRVIKLLGLEGIFEGITFCDYGAERLLCKPHKDMFAKAMKEAGVENVEDCYFVGKSCFSLTGWLSSHFTLTTLCNRRQWPQYQGCTCTRLDSDTSGGAISKSTRDSCWKVSNSESPRTETDLPTVVQIFF